MQGIDVGPILNIILVGGAVAVIFAILSVFLKPKIKGWAGEFLVKSRLAKLPSDRYYVMNDILLDYNNATTQIDHIVLSPYGLFVIETKNYKGYIFGGEKQKRWTQVLSKHNKYQFQNPLHQNFLHVKALESIIGCNSIHSIVVFTDGVFKTQLPDNVIRHDQILDYIYKYDRTFMPGEKVMAFVERIEERMIEGREARRKHVEQIKKRTRNQ